MNDELKENFEKHRLRVIKERLECETELESIHKISVDKSQEMHLFQIHERISKLECEIDCIFDAQYTEESHYTEPSPDELKNINLDNIYYDQSPYYLNHPNLQIGAILLPYGIKNIDKFLSHIIINYDKNDYTFEEIEILIKHNTHLHNIIKYNLLSNLDTINQVEVE